MHELAIAQSIFEAVEERATECNAARVKSVRLRIGEANAIVADSLTFCFEMLTNLNPLLTGTQLFIDAVPYRGRCRHCATEFPIMNFVAQCPACGEWSDEVVSGTELQILEMEIEAS